MRMLSTLITRRVRRHRLPQRSPKLPSKSVAATSNIFDPDHLNLYMLLLTFNCEILCCFWDVPCHFRCRRPSPPKISAVNYFDAVILEMYATRLRWRMWEEGASVDVAPVMVYWSSAVPQIIDSSAATARSLSSTSYMLLLLLLLLLLLPAISRIFFSSSSASYSLVLQFHFCVCVLI